MSTERTFPTKTGTCTITQDEIVLDRAGVRGAAAEVVVGNSVGQALLKQAITGFSLVTVGVWAVREGSLVLGTLPLALGAMLLVSTVASRNNSAAPVIKRGAIRSIEAHAPRPLLTRGYFTVHFKQGDREVKRLIMLPSKVRDARTQFDAVVQTMREAGLPVS